MGTYREAKLKGSFKAQRFLEIQVWFMFLPLRLLWKSVSDAPLGYMYQVSRLRQQIIYMQVFPASESWPLALDDVLTVLFQSYVHGLFRFLRQSCFIVITHNHNDVNQVTDTSFWTISVQNPVQMLLELFEYKNMTSHRSHVSVKLKY